MLAGDSFIPKLHLRQAVFTYGACGTFTKHHELIKKFRETDNLNHIYKNELNKACSVLDARYSDSNNSANRTIPDKILKTDLMKVL